MRQQAFHCLGTPSPHCTVQGRATLTVYVTSTGSVLDEEFDNV